jgi:hypothetical protein
MAGLRERREFRNRAVNEEGVAALWRELGLGDEEVADMLAAQERVDEEGMVDAWRGLGFGDEAIEDEMGFSRGDLALFRWGGSLRPRLLESSPEITIWTEGVDDATPPSVYRDVLEGLDRAVGHQLYVRGVYSAYDHAPAGRATQAEFGPGGEIRGQDLGPEVDAQWRPLRAPGAGGYLAGILQPGDGAAKLRAAAAVLRELGYGYRPAGWAVAAVPMIGGAAREWLPMREGGNCVVRLVRENLRAGRTLTAGAEQWLAMAEAKYGESGVAEDGLAWLCKKLKMRIEVLDIEDTPIWTPRDANGVELYKNCRKVTIYRSNGHAFSAKPQMPRVEAVETYEVEPGMRGYEADTEGVLRAVTHEGQMLRAILPAVEARGLLRVFVVGSEVVAGSTVFRPSALNTALNAEAGLEGEGCILHLGGLQSYRFGQWRLAQRVGSLPKSKAVREAWRESCLESTPWRAPGNPLGPLAEYDMRAAYLACELSARSTGPASRWAARCGFPRGEVQRLARVATLDEVEEMTGCVRFLQLELASDLHPATASQLARHFAARAWIPIPVALYLRDSGAIAAHRLEQVCYSVGRLAGLQFGERDSAVRFIGSCAYRGARQTIWIRDEAEASYYQERFRERGAVVLRTCGGFLLSFDTNEMRADHSYVRSYVLGYMFIAMTSAVRHAGAAVCAVTVDCLTLSELPPASPEFPLWTGAGALLFGMFRPKAGSGYHPLCVKAAPRTEFPPSAELPAARLTKDRLHRELVTFLDGQGGAGKTHRALRAFPGHRVVVLVSNNEQCIDAESKLAEIPEADRPLATVHTYHEFFRLGSGDPEQWDVACMAKSVRPDTVIWDEVGTVPSMFLDRALAWLSAVHACVVLCGDPAGQMEPINATSGGEVIARHATYTEFMAKDWRAEGCPALRALKLRCWRQDEATQVQGLHELPLLGLDEVARTWSPADTILVLRRADGRRVAEPKRPVQDRIRLRFAPSEARRAEYRKKGGVLPEVLVPGDVFDDRAVPAAVGRRVTVGAGTEYDPELWTEDVWSTIHSVQGRTVRAPGRLIIVEDGLGAAWARNAIYTAVSRAERLSQLYRVVLTSEARAEREDLPGEEYE